MTIIEIDRATIARKRAEAESLELQARRLRSDASEIELKLLVRENIAFQPSWMTMQRYQGK